MHIGIPFSNTSIVILCLFKSPLPQFPSPLPSKPLLRMRSPQQKDNQIRPYPPTTQRPTRVIPSQHIHLCPGFRSHGLSYKQENNITRIEPRASEIRDAVNAHLIRDLLHLLPYIKKKDGDSDCSNRDGTGSGDDDLTGSLNEDADEDTGPGDQAVNIAAHKWSGADSKDPY